MPLIPNLSLYPVQKIDRLALWGSITILELHFAETQVYIFYIFFQVELAVTYHLKEVGVFSTEIKKIAVSGTDIIYLVPDSDLLPALLSFCQFQQNIIASLNKFCHFFW